MNRSDATVAAPPAAEGPSPSRDLPGASKRRPPVALLLLILIALYALPAWFMMKPVGDPDIWWHLATGRWVVEHGALPQTDPFSAYGQGRPYVAYSWLFDVLVHGLHQWLGLTGILAFRLVAVSAVLVAIHRFVVRREPRFLWATVLTALAFGALAGMLYERTWLFTLLFTLFTLEAVLRLRAGTATRAVWLLPVVFALWANLHVQFIYGLALLGLACATPFADVLLKGPTSGQWADTPGTPAWRQLVTLTAACAAATLVNPYHVRLYGAVIEYASQAVPFQVVLELKAPLFRQPADWAFLALALGGAFALGRRQPRPSLFELLLFAGTAFAAFRSRRDTWILILVSLAVLTTGPSPSLRQVPQFVLSWRRAAVVAAGVAVILAALWRQNNLSERGLAAAVAGNYPVAAVEHVREAGYAGPLFNDFEWGGYLIWALPEHPVSMDGRVNLHGDERLARHYDTTQGLPYKDTPWDKDHDLMTARLVIVKNGQPLTSLLQLHPRFRRVYPTPDREDKLTSVFVAREETTQPRP